VTSRSAALVVAIVVVLVPSLALAHPGHGQSDGGSLRHYLTEPEHLVALLAVVAAVVLVAALGRPHARRQGRRGR
jgi:hydrogenase/urease accessory protein HupE